MVHMLEDRVEPLAYHPRFDQRLPLHGVTEQQMRLFPRRIHEHGGPSPSAMARMDRNLLTTSNLNAGQLVGSVSVVTGRFRA